jgi:virginiamycin B lyase
MQKDQSKKLISRREAIAGLVTTGAALGTGFFGVPSAFASSHVALAQPTVTKFKAAMKTSQVALKHVKVSGKTSKVAPKSYTLKTNAQASLLSAQDAQATFSAYPVKTTAYAQLGKIVTGDDGSSFWFVEQAANRIGKISTQGVITEYLLPLSGYQPSSIANGPGDTFWFPYVSTNNGTSFIGRMTGASGQVTLYQLSVSLSSATAITRGPNDTLWFVSGKNQIGSVTADGTIKTYTLNGVTWTQDIAQGPDGALWFTYTGDTSPQSGVARFTTDGSLTFYPVTEAGMAQITTGRDNDLWFAVFEDEQGSEQKNVGRITTSGALTRYYMPQLKDNSYPYSIAYLGNGTFAFGTVQEGAKGSSHEYVGIITPAGDVQAFDTPNADQVFYMAYAGWANEIWFTTTSYTNKGKDKVYKFRLTN